jgi:hypothetical protein
VNRCGYWLAICRKLFTRILLYQKTWNAHITAAQKLADWTLVTDESSETHLPRRSAQNLFSRSSTELKLEEITGFQTFFKKLSTGVNIDWTLLLLTVNRNDYVPFNDHISEIWTTLASYEPSNAAAWYRCADTQAWSARQSSHPIIGVFQQNST